MTLDVSGDKLNSILTIPAAITVPIVDDRDTALPRALTLDVMKHERRLTSTISRVSPRLLVRPVQSPNDQHFKPSCRGVASRLTAGSRGDVSIPQPTNGLGNR